jgi:hypothetical protein
MQGASCPQEGRSARDASYAKEEGGSVRSEKLSREEFLRRAFGMGGVVAAVSVLAACAPGEEEDETKRKTTINGRARNS